MIAKDYDRCAQELFELAGKIEREKRPAYTLKSADVFWNFKSVAARLGLSPMQAWGVYFLKHIDAITALARDPAIPQAEEIAGRFADAINYLKLGYALHREQFPEADEEVTKDEFDLP